MSKKKKKEKIIYYDDNSTISDMSEVGGLNGKKRTPPPQYSKPKSTFREKWKTYWASVRMMFLPMLIVLGIIGVLYLFLMFSTGNLG